MLNHCYPHIPINPFSPIFSMSTLTQSPQTINTIHYPEELIPVLHGYYDNWSIKVVNREFHTCANYLSPNRREFYKVLFTTRGTGIMTVGTNTYYIDEPTILFIHPNDIVSWKNLSEDTHAGYFVLFQKSFVASHPQLKSTIDRFGLFTEKQKSVIRLSESEVSALSQLFERMYTEDIAGGPYSEDSLQAYLQLVMVESMKIGRFPKPEVVSDEYRHVHEFFSLLEQETAHINATTPIKIKTAKEFASMLAVHPNHLNALLKKHTGQNVSTHIRNRLLEEAKALLVQTDWPLHIISYSLGFAEQPSFNFFFKKNTGATPAEFRRKKQFEQD